MERWKKLTGIFLSLVMLAVCVPGIRSQASTVENMETEAAEPAEPEENVVQENEAVQEEGETNETPAPAKIRLSVGNEQKTPKYQAGQQVEAFTLNIVNEGNQDAGNVRITPVIDQAAEWPFEIESMNYEKKLDVIEAGSMAEAVWENLKVREDVETKNYKLQFHISYDNGVEEAALDKYIYVHTTAKPKMQQAAPDTTAQSKAPGESAQELADAGSFSNGDIMVSGGGGGGASENKSVPRVIVTGFGTEPGIVNAGSNFKLIVHVKNTSAATAVSNMLFDFQAPSSGTEAAAEAPAFLPSSGASSVYLDCIPAGETRDIAIDLNARADLVQKPYSINMSMIYEDGNASQYEGSSSLAIPVQQAARFEFSDIELSPASISVGEEANLMCSLYNTGRVKLYNVKVQFTGDGISAKDVFVGNLDSGATGTIDGMITGESEIMAGTRCRMVVTYEDESGNVSSTEEEFELEVLPAMETDAGMMEEMPVEEKSFPVLPAVIGAVVLGVVILTVVLLRAKKKRRLRAEEEDLADEVDRFTEDE